MSKQHDIAAAYLALSAAQIQQKRADAYEAAVVQYIIQHTGLAKQASRIAAAGNGQLRCVGLMAATDWPYFIGAVSVKHNPRLDALLDKRFASTRPYKAYMGLFQDVPSRFEGTTQAMLVFPWREHSRFMALHTYEIAVPRGRHYTHDDQVFHLDYLEDILRLLGGAKEW
jgi:DNA-binding transcriptional regulator YdaS (Cro superfamily)